MNPIRLSVEPPDDATRAGLVARLHRAVVVRPGEPADAALLVDDAALAEELLAAGVPVVLVGDPIPQADWFDRFCNFSRIIGTPFGVVNPDRYLPSRRLLHQQLHSGLGRPGLIRLHRWEPAGSPDPLLRDLDVTLWLAGLSPERVYAVERREGAGRILQVHLGFPGGAMALLDHTDTLPPGDGYASLSVIASTGAAYADDHHNVHLAYRGGPVQAIRADERAGVLAAIAQDFVDALHGDNDLLAPNEVRWRPVFLLAHAVGMSLTSGQAVAVTGG